MGGCDGMSWLIQCIHGGLGCENWYDWSWSCWPWSGTGLRAGTLRNAGNPWTGPALSRAAYFGHLAVVEYLVGQGANIEATARDLSRPLHWAALGGYLSVVEYLVGAGASLTATSTGGATPRDSAVSRGHTAIVSYFDSL